MPRASNVEVKSHTSSPDASDSQARLTEDHQLSPVSAMDQVTGPKASENINRVSFQGASRFAHTANLVRRINGLGKLHRCEKCGLPMRRLENFRTHVAHCQGSISSELDEVKPSFGIDSDQPAEPGPPTTSELSTELELSIKPEQPAESSIDNKGISLGRLKYLPNFKGPGIGVDAKLEGLDKRFTAPSSTTEVDPNPRVQCQTPSAMITFDIVSSPESTGPNDDAINEMISFLRRDTKPTAADLDAARLRTHNERYLMSIAGMYIETLRENVRDILLSEPNVVKISQSVRVVHPLH